MRWIAALLSVCLATPALAGTLAGVSMPDSAEVAGKTLKLNGMGLRKKAIFKVYVGGLYLDTSESDTAQILAQDEPRRMIMTFVRSVDQAKLCAAWDSGLAANVPGAGAELKAQFKTLCDYTPDVSNGTALMYTYVPGEGTHVEAAGKEQGTIEGKEFADALFSLWIGDVPPSAQFKNGLLGK